MVTEVGDRREDPSCLGYLRIDLGRFRSSSLCLLLHGLDCSTNQGREAVRLDGRTRQSRPCSLSSLPAVVVRPPPPGPAHDTRRQAAPSGVPACRRAWNDPDHCRTAAGAPASAREAEAPGAPKTSATPSTRPGCCRPCTPPCPQAAQATRRLLRPADGAPACPGIGPHRPTHAAPSRRSEAGSPGRGVRPASCDPCASQRCRDGTAPRSRLGKCRTPHGPHAGTRPGLTLHHLSIAERRPHHDRRTPLSHPRHAVSV